MKVRRGVIVVIHRDYDPKETTDLRQVGLSLLESFQCVEVGFMSDRVER